MQGYQEPTPSQAWAESSGEEPAKGAQQLQRYSSALWRFKWLILLLVILGSVGGVFATNYIEPEFEVTARVLLSPDKSGPADAADGFQQAGLLDLLVSGEVVDPVVTSLSLFVTPDDLADSTIFRDFTIGGGVVPGEYTLRLNGDRYELFLDKARLVETGAIGASIGRPVGFVWQPPATALANRRTIDFVVKTPRETSFELINKLRAPTLRSGSNILKLSLTGADAEKTQTTLNEWTLNFVAVATRFKKYGVSSRATVLEGQLEYAREELTGAEAALSGFMLRTATEPGETRIPQLAGGELRVNPVYSMFFEQQYTAERLRRDRENIERALTAGPEGSVGIEALLSVPSVNNEAAASKLRDDLTEALKLETQLRGLSQVFTEEEPRYQRPAAALAQLRTAVIPSAARSLMTQLEQRERDLGVQIATQKRDLRGIPSRTIELARLERNVDVANIQYRQLMLQAQEAKLAEATTPPDISVLDSAIAPLRPTKNTGPVVIAGAIAAALALGIALAILLDMLDKRFRYPQQATDELGLFILGVIPAINRKRRRSTEQAAQMVEAFRSIRMNMRYAVDPSRPFAVTISSPGPNDGKSLVSSNLALSFADGGSRVILVDGDIRRGELQETFKVTGKPGLVDYLDGTALLPEVLRSTSHPNLTLMPCGKRQRRAPELLTGPRLTQLVSQLQREYDVVIIDSPPLGAGADAYTLGIAAGNMVVVLRAGLTDRKMAAAKLSTVETLPIRVLGSVLNGIQMTGVYQYYSYYLDYEAKDEDQVKALPKSAERVSAVKIAGD